jgi:hypothetical protein
LDALNELAVAYSRVVAHSSFAASVQVVAFEFDSYAYLDVVVALAFAEDHPLTYSNAFLAFDLPASDLAVVYLIGMKVDRDSFGMFLDLGLVYN